MNKYSSKAIKTAATVGMSLAMVLSNAAPVMAATTVCSTVNESFAKDAVVGTKKIDNVYAVADQVTALQNALKKLAETKKVPYGAVEINAHLGFTVDAGTDVKVENDINTEVTASITKVTYGYYADEAVSLGGLPILSANDIVPTIAPVVLNLSDYARNSDAVKKDVKAAVEELGGWTSSKEITNADGTKGTANFKVVVKEGATEITEEDLDTKTFTTGAVTVEKIAVEAYKDYTDCTTTGTGLDITDRYTAKNAYNEIVSAFDKAKVSFEDIKPGEKVDFAGKTITESLGNKAILTDTTIPQLDIDFKAVLKELARYLDNTTDEGKAVERLLDIDSAMTDMFKTGGNLDKAKGYNEDTKFKTTKEYTDAVDLLEEFNKFDTYLTNLKDGDSEAVTDAKSVLEDLVNNYVIENDGDLLDAYLTKLDKYYEAFVDSKGDNGITKSDVDTAIKNIKNGATVNDIKNKDIVLEKSEYTTFKEDAGVEEYMTKFEDMYDEIQAVKDAVATSNEAYKALIKDGSDSVRSFLKDKEFKDIKSKITLEDYKILKAYKEEVLDAVLTLETKEVGNSYVNKSKKSIFATKAQLNKVLGNISNDTDLDKGIFTKLDKENGEFNWDKLVKHMEKVEASLEAITTNIEKLDAVSLTVNDRAAILAADDAVYFLTDDGAGNLTKAETRTVKNADRKVTELMEAYRIKFGSLNVELNSWVNKGNGDWAYYENGNAVTKWVASGSDWYYVKGGVMLRNSWIASDSQGTKWYYVDDAGKMVSNTTVNGYTFNSYGVWVK